MERGFIDGLLDKPEDFEAWVSPKALLHELTPLIGGRHKAAREADVRLKHGLLTAVAGSAHWSERGRETLSVLVVISPATWKSAPRIGDPDLDFWTSGSLVVNTHEPGRSPLARTFFDVRFYPHSVANIAAIKIARADPIAVRQSSLPRVSRPDGPGTAPTKKGEPVSNDQAKVWYRALTRPDKALGLRALWAKAKSEVGPGVLRKQIEPFVAGRRTGPKVSRP